MTFRVAVVGLGWAARTIWLPRLAAHPGMTVTAVVDPDPAARSSFLDDTGDVRVLSTLEELTRVTVDLAIVAVPNHAHTPVACALLRRGIPVFVEKPVCLSTAEADDLAEAEKAGDTVLIAGSAARYRGDIQALERLVASLGPVRHVRLAWVRARGVPGTNWFTQRSKAGGGALVDLGWHLLDTALPLLSPVRFDQVVGTVGHDFVNHSLSQAVWREDEPDRPPLRAGDVEDTARAFLTTDGGVSVSLHASWASHAEYDTTLVEVHGRTGTAVLSCAFGFSPNRLGGSMLTLTRNGQVVPVPLDDDPVGAEYDRQVDALPGLLADPGQRGKAVEATRTTIGLIERIYASAPHVPGGRNTERGTGMDTELITSSEADPPRTALRAVIFDLDGVLVDSFEVMREAFGIAYREVVGDGEPPFEEYSRHLGRYFPDIMNMMGLPLEMEAPFVRASYRLADRVRLFDGVIEMLSTLRERGLQIAVATGKTGARARALLEGLGVLPMFDHVIGSDEVARAKPAPDIVLRALDLLGVEPGEAVMVGDAVADLASARGAGVAAVAALWGESDPEPLLDAAPDVALESPADLVAWLKEAGW